MKSRLTTRRSILKAGALALGCATMPSSGQATTRPKGRRIDLRYRPDLADEAVRKSIEIVQLTTDPAVGSTHIYMEAQIFTPDSKRFVLQRSGHAHGSDRKDPKHQFLLCDIEDGCSLHPLTDELGAIGPAVSPDGRYFYYFAEEAEGRVGRMLLKRVQLDGTHRETILVVDRPLPGTSTVPRRLYTYSALSSDGKRLAMSGSVEERDSGALPYVLFIVDLERMTVQPLLQGTTWCNTHPQYCRSPDPARARDLLVQQNHSYGLDSRGGWAKLADEAGADIHVIRDDGTQMRSMPWGRDGNEACQGHQCWRGRSDWAIMSTVTARPPENQLIEGRPVPAMGHLGALTPGGVRNDLSRTFPKPAFFHFAVNAAGNRLITDAEPFAPSTCRIYLARLGEPGHAPLTDFVCLARPRASGRSPAHIHPFFSPDGRMAFFNSDESGLTQAYMIRGFA